MGRWASGIRKVSATALASMVRAGAVNTAYFGHGLAAGFNRREFRPKKVRARAIMEAAGAAVGPASDGWRGRWGRVTGGGRGRGFWGAPVLWVGRAWVRVLLWGGRAGPGLRALRPGQRPCVVWGCGAALVAA